MKRLVLRISTLVAVVVLGLIAIAQAQRGTDPAADPPDVGLRADSGDAGEPRPLVPAPDARLMSSPERFGTRNPLRDRVSPTAGEAVAEGAAPPPTRPSAAATPELSPANDPFADRARAADVFAGRANRTAAAPPSAALVDPPSGAREPLATAGLPAARAPGPAPLAVETAPSEGIPDARSAAGAPAPASPPGAAPREPAPFQLDPSAPSSSIPSARSGPQLGGSGESGGIPDLNGAGTGRFPAPDPLGRREAAAGPDGTGQPGNKQLEGPQSPQVTIQKIAPPEVQVGKPARFQIKVINTGSVTATSVELRDQVPKGTQLVSTTPQAQRGVGGELVWNLGAMPPGQETTVELELVPTAEGEIGSVATIRYAAEASARTVATKPELQVQVTVPSQVVIGEEVAMSITVSNPGSGVATGVVIEEHVPAGLQHPAGTELEYEIGTLKPGESRKLDLTLTAARPGPYANVLVARGEGNLRTEARQDLQVVAPQLDVAMAGPSRRYLEREATYTVSVSNPGTAPARDVDLVAELPPGMKFVAADNQGHYEEATRTVHWRLAELPVNTTGSVKLTALPVEAGQKTIRVAGSAEKVASVQKEHAVEVEGIVAINFQVADSDDPIEKNGETTYEIKVFNQGSKTASNVQLEAILPAELRVVAAEGPVRHAIEGSRVRFESLSRLAPKADATYRVRVQGLQPGDLRIRVQLLADEMERPVVKEESTRVYSDE